jgi:hypothetical protein
VCARTCAWRACTPTSTVSHTCAIAEDVSLRHAFYCHVYTPSDDETGSLVYSYPREIEEERQRRKSEGADGGSADDVGRGQSQGRGGGLESGPATPRQGSALAGGSKSIDDWFGAGGGNMQPSRGVDKRSSESGRGRGVGSGGGGGGGGAGDGRMINREGSGAAARMPALVNGVLVLAPAKGGAGPEADGGGEGHERSWGGGAAGRKDDNARSNGAHDVHDLLLGRPSRAPADDKV